VVHILNESKENWKITLIDTGEDANTGLRLARAESYIDQEDFFFTYGDGLSNVDLRNLKEQHVLSGKIATLTAVAPPGRFGLVQIDNGIVTKFDEKKNFSNERINGGFFVLNKRIFSYLTTKNPSFEFEILPKLAANRQLGGYLHNGFWQAMDTMRDKDYLEELLQKGKHPWMT
jgi:glucose-1-phosphate cytidylyltransferase